MFKECESQECESHGSPVSLMFIPNFAAVKGTSQVFNGKLLVVGGLLDERTGIFQVSTSYQKYFGTCERGKLNDIGIVDVTLANCVMLSAQFKCMTQN